LSYRRHFKLFADETEEGPAVNKEMFSGVILWEIRFSFSTRIVLRIDYKCDTRGCYWS